MNEYIFDIDYTFIGNAVSAQAQLNGMLADNQFLIVESIELDEESGLLQLTCRLHEEKIN